MTDDRDHRLYAEIVSVLRDNSLSPRSVADRIITLCTERVSNPTQNELSQVTDNTTPGLEGFLWALWGIVIVDIAFVDPDSHQRLIEIVRCIKEQGRMGCESWMIWGAEMDWRELPIFGAQARELFNGPVDCLPRDVHYSPEDTPELAYSILSGDSPSDPTDPIASAFIHARESYLNYVRFVMRMTVSEVSSFKLWAIWIMRGGLEDLFYLDTPEEKLDLFYGFTRTLKIEAASVCIQEAGKLIYRSTDDYTRPGSAPGSGGKRWAGVQGFHPDRWKLWKTVFQEIVDTGVREDIRPNAVEAAKTAIECMERVEEDCN